MAQFADFRIAFFGPPGVGKTETLRQLAQGMDGPQGNRLISFSTRDQSTLLYDYYLVDLGPIEGVTVRFHLYALPGKENYLLAARMGLHAADAVVFVTDGRDSHLPETLSYLKLLSKILGEVDRDLEKHPKVIQINKVDLAARDGGGALTERRLKQFQTAVVKTQAPKGEGVKEVFQEVVKAVLTPLGPLPDGLPPHPRGKPAPVKVDPELAREVTAANEIYLRTFSSSTTAFTPHSEVFLGAILEKYNLLSAPQVQEALNIRTRALKGDLELTLGEVLLKKGFLETEDLERGQSLKALSEIIHEEILYGKIALERNLVPFEKFRNALLFQKNNHFQYSLGTLFQDAGAIDARQHLQILHELQKLHHEEIRRDRELATGRTTVRIPRPDATDRKTTMFFGSLAVKNKFISKDQLSEALDYQKKLRDRGVKKYLGVILQEMGFLSPREVDIICSSLEKHIAKNPIKGYKIEAQLGRGAMGLVYAALQLKLDRIVALKVLDPKYAMDQDYIQRFYMEAKTAATLNHPNIVQAYDVGESMGYHYFAMEYVQGVTVKQLLEERKTIQEEEALDIILQMVSALHHAEVHHMAHLDIKPSNIMISTSGIAKLCDLGLAKKTDSVSEQDDNMIMGSPYYISPEQIERNPELDSRSDMYSLGATLYHMIAGRPPYTGKTTKDIFMKHLTHRVPDPTEIIPGLSSGLFPMLKKMMQKEREERFENMESLWKTMTKVRGVEGESLRTEGIRSFTRRLSRFLRLEGGGGE
ncbi:MAG: protein kinase domain-containing protein [Planctomycetota bacterium]